MERIIIDKREWVPLRDILGVICRVVFFAGLGLGIGIVVSLPWLYQTQSLMLQQNKVEMERCRQQSARLMLAVRDVRTCRGIGGER